MVSAEGVCVLLKQEQSQLFLIWFLYRAKMSSTAKKAHLKMKFSSMEEATSVWEQHTLLALGPSAGPPGDFSRRVEFRAGKPGLHLSTSPGLCLMMRKNASEL